MGKWHGYIGIENLSLNPAQRQTLIGALTTLGPVKDRQPARLLHWRARLDNEAAIFEALFDEDNLTINKFKQRLGAIFGISWVTIAAATQDRNFGGGTTPVVTFSRTGTDYIRFALFGGPGSTWSQSGDECTGYLAANRVEWEVPWQF